MPTDAKTKVELTLLTSDRPVVTAATKRPFIASQPINVLLHSFAMAAAVWAFLLYFSLLMFAFLWSLSEAQDLYATIIDGKPINWVITAAVITGIALHAARLKAARKRRNPAPQYSPPPASDASAARRRKTGGVYASANAASDYEIDAALRGKTGGFGAMFEE